MEKIPSIYYRKLWFTLSERPLWGAAAWILLIGLVASIQLVDYLQFDLTLILGVMIFPLIWEVEQKSQYSWRYAWGGFISLSLYAYLHMQVFFLLGVGMCLFWLVESRLGKIGKLPLIWLGLISPVASYVISSVSFPLRLTLSEWAAKSFQLIGIDITVSGNIFMWGGYEFAVDPVCMGLNSLITAWMVVTLFIALQQRKTNKSAPLWVLSFLYLLTALLSLLSNFFRIICLVLFRSMPETLSHELIGLICLGLYVLLPMYFMVAFVFSRESPWISLSRSQDFIFNVNYNSVFSSLFIRCFKKLPLTQARWPFALRLWGARVLHWANMFFWYFFSKKSTRNCKEPTKLPYPTSVFMPCKTFLTYDHFVFRRFHQGSKILSQAIWLKRFVSIGFFITISFLVWNNETFTKEIIEGRAVEAKIEGLKMKVLKTGIIQYTSPDLLVYIKPPTRFWGVSHSPEICWEGSGYTFFHIWETEVCGKTVYMGKLTQADDILFTAWWYENGEMTTNQQWEWRGKTAQGEAPFSLVNLATTSEEKLLMYCERWLE